MFCYKAYGLGIQSEVELPELVKAEGAIDAVVRVGVVDFTRPIGADGADWIWATRDEACLQHLDAGTFRIREGKEIVIAPIEGVDPGLVRVLLLGPVLSLMLHQRGYMLLHSSCIDVDGAAVAFVADKGTGKSTLAGAFVSRGYGIVADDLIAVDINAKDGAMVHPGFPQLKLWPDAVEGMGEDPAALPTINSFIEKRARRAEKFADRALPLRGIYSIQEGGERQTIERMSGHAAFMELCKHSYVLPLLKTTGKLAHHFDQAVALVKQVPVQRLLRRREHAALGELVEMVRNDVAQHVS